jgi:hypothetical protein
MGRRKGTARGGPAARRARVVEAERFVVRDARGRARAELGCGRDGVTRLRLRDEAGVVRASLSQGEHGGAELVLRDAAGRERVCVGCGPCGSSVVTLYDDRHDASVVLEARDGLPGLVAAVGPADPAEECAWHRCRPDADHRDAGRN